MANIKKYESEEEFFKTAAERQDFFLVNDGATWQLFPYISLETAVYSEGTEKVPDVLLLNLGGGRGVEIHGRALLRVLQAFQGRQVVNLALGSGRPRNRSRPEEAKESSIEQPLSETRHWQRVMELSPSRLHSSRVAFTDGIRSRKTPQILHASSFNASGGEADAISPLEFLLR